MKSFGMKLVALILRLTLMEQTTPASGATQVAAKNLAER